MDPFHDNQLDNLSGWPDAVTTPSIIRQVKESLEITNTGDQDIYVVVFPWTNTPQLGNYAQTANTVALPGGAAVTIPEVSYYKTSPGVAMNLGTSPTGGTALETGYQKGLGRLIGMGIEWINTTAPIYRSGTAYCWRSPGLQEETEVMQYLTAGSITRAGGVRRLGPPPTSVRDIMHTPGTRSWAAEEGCYMVVPFSNSENPPMYPNTNNPVMNTSTIGPMEVQNSNPGDTIVTGPATTSGIMNRLVPTNTIGCCMTGTGTNFKSSLNIIWYYEEFPDPASDVLTLATPSCESDPVALALYSAALNTLPVAVPSSWNAAGDWWWDVVTAIKEHAKTIGSILGGPKGAAVGVAAGTVAGFVRDRYMKDQYLTSPGAGRSSVPQQLSRQMQNQQKMQQMRKQNNQNQKAKKKKKRKGGVEVRETVTLARAPGKPVSFTISQKK